MQLPCACPYLLGQRNIKSVKVAHRPVVMRRSVWHVAAWTQAECLRYLGRHFCI